MAKIRETIAPMWLITGSTGFIGRLLVKHILKHGKSPEHDILVLVRNRKKLEKVLPELKNGPESSDQPQCRVIEGDLHQLENLTPLCQHIRGVVHVAGLVTAHNRADFDRVNLDGTTSLHQHLQKHGNINDIRWLQISSLAANGPVKLSRDSRDPYLDQDKPVSWYGQSKLAADQYLRQAHPQERLVIIRPPAVFGEVNAAWIPFLRMIKKGFLPTWRGRVMPYFSMIAERHLISTIWTLMIYQKRVAHSIYPTFAYPVHWDQMMSIWKEALGVPRKNFISVPVYPRGLQMFAKAVHVASRLKPLEKKLKFSSDKLREMAAYHWVKDGASQLADLGIQVPKVGIDDWKRCVKAWKERGWLS